MSNEELVELIQQGETDRLPELWAQVEGLARYHANRYTKAITRGGVDTNRGELFEDFFYGCGWPALVAAVETFNPDAGGAFSTWYSYYFKREVYRLRGWRWRVDAKTGQGGTVELDAMGRAMSLNTPLSNDRDAGELQDIVADPADCYEDADRCIYLEQLHEALESALNTMPDELSDTLRRRFYDGQTLAEVSEDVHINPENVRMRESKALRCMRHPRVTRVLRPFLYPDEDIHAAGLHGTGLYVYINTGESSVERVVLAMEGGKEI